MGQSLHLPDRWLVEGLARRPWALRQLGRCERLLPARFLSQAVSRCCLIPLSRPNHGCIFTTGSHEAEMPFRRGHTCRAIWRYSLYSVPNPA